jgi:transmembrane sensor
MEHTPEHIWLLIARKLSGEATQDELQELEGLLRENPSAGYSKEVLHDLWQNHPYTDRQYSENRYKKLVQQLKHMGIDDGKFTHDDHYINSGETEEISTKSGRRKWLVALSTAAVIVTVVCVYYLSGPSAINKESYPALAKNQISTKNGSKTSLELPDGTKVWLNSGSQLVYDKNYGNKLREVSLIGEAYFDVVKNPERPFLIHTSKMDVKVLGTAFNVKCYPGEKTTETSLVRGSVEITLKDRQEKIRLKQNEKLIINNEDYQKVAPVKIADVKKAPGEVQNPKPIITVSHLTLLPADNTVIETAWVQNRLIFNGESFEDVALKMERWYNVKIDFDDERLLEEKLTGNFERETVEQALNALKLVAPFTYTIKNDRVMIFKMAVKK